ncbi:quinoprotein amine dehydrogenase, beta chain-like [Actinidia rufa]|uniref:Quinoprotein amine dehydrogenase, beta chain-like n=1 Tax=Actinidia rufa TaxID=165716 RepID=A0A7J0F1M8_9ERIC|nr:quinoprotein amine dehydrogenase, beta chain-like [Actinidia rufa]
MYMAYGWPQVIPLESGLCPTSEQIIYLRVTNRLLLVVAPSHLEIWSSSQHKVRLGKYKRDLDSIQREGENVQAVWSPECKLIAVLVSVLLVPICTFLRSTSRKKRILIGGKQPSGLFLATISLLLNEPVPFSNTVSATSNIVCDSKHLLVGLSDGSLYNISWKGEFYGAFGLNFLGHNGNEATKLSYSQNNGLASAGVQGASMPSHYLSQRSAIMQLEFSLPLRLLFVIFLDGQLVLCSVSKKGLKQAESIESEKWLGSGDVACASVATEQQILAVGTRRGVVELYDLAESASLIRSVSLYDWGYSMEDTGIVNCIAWTPDNSAFAVGWKLRGLAVWSVSGCRLMSTIRQIGLSSVSSPVVKPNHDCKYEPMMGGTSLMHWDEYAYRLYAVEERSSERIIAFFLLANVALTEEFLAVLIPVKLSMVKIDCLLCSPKILTSLRLCIFTFQFPIYPQIGQFCMWQLARMGCTWLLLAFMGLLWLGKIVVVCNYIDSSNTYELLFYPRYHLDQSSLLCRKPLLAKPMVMDVYEDYLLVTYRPLDVHIFHVKLSGELTPSSTPDLLLSTVRELSIMTAKSHPAAMRFIPDQLPRENLSTNPISTADLLDTEPVRCLILRANGELSLLDLDDGRERVLTDSVWYPSSGVDRFKQEDFLQLDPELEFDREVYPLGLLPNAGVVVGVCQRMSFSACTEFPCFEPSPQAQTILHCLLRHLLQRNKSEEALRLALLSAEKPHFSHCLEWLLFTVFDADISRQSANKNQISVPKSATSTNYSLLEKTCDLIKNFPEYFDVVVSVARKTDGRHWADLFSAAGRATELFEECFQRRWYRTAACYILVIAKLEGPAVSQYCALRLLQATLDESLYELAGELEYLQRERYGSARLDNFASGLELIGQKLQMGTLQSRLDAEFLLAHMCSVKFKEWIVVLATLLRRSEVLFDLFQHDMRLWKAYSVTLQSHPVFAEYQELLESLEEQLSSTPSLEEK